MDFERLQTYYDTRNYAEAARYLRANPAKDGQSQLEVNALIEKLERDAAIQQTKLKNATQEEREAFSFMQALHGQGTIPRTRSTTYNEGTPQQYRVDEHNEYGTEFLNNMQNLRANNGTRIDRIAVQLVDDEALAAITSALGYENINENDLGIKHNVLSDGTHRLTISATNGNMYKLINAANDIASRSWGDIASYVGSTTAFGTGVGSAFGVPGALIGAGAGFVVGSAVEGISYLMDSNKVNIAGIDVKGGVHFSDDFNISNLEDAIDICNEANEVYNEFNKKNSEEQYVTSETEATQFLGTGHAEAYKAWQNGLISIDDFNKIEENWKQYYDGLIDAADFAKFDVYAWAANTEGDDDSKGVVLEKVNNEDLPDLKGEVLLAKDDGRLSYRLVIRDGAIGTMLTIKPKNDKESWSKAKGEVHKEIFIEGLFDESANALFERDTKTIAAKQNADMKRYNYERTLDTGTTVGYGEGVGSYKKEVDGTGKVSIIPISEDDMLKILDENAIITQSVSQVLANIDENGEMYPQSVNGQWVNTSAETKLKELAIQGTNELYPKGSIPDVKRAAYSNQLYLKMLKMLDVYRKNFKED